MRQFKEREGKGKTEETKNSEELEINEGFNEVSDIERSREALTIQEISKNTLVEDKSKQPLIVPFKIMIPLKTLEKRKIRQVRDEREDGEKRKEYLILWEGEEEVQCGYQPKS
jgi:hypothetical protein